MDIMEGIVTIKHTPKPWGYELLWAHTPEYVGKILVVRAGEQLSLQYHEHKDETIYVLQGMLRYFVGGIGDLQEIALLAGQSYRNKPGVVHRIVAITDCVVLEASTPHLDDVVRVEDKYGR
jgi:mannose-6-phosphate isomerase